MTTTSCCYMHESIIQGYTSKTPSGDFITLHRSNNEAKNKKKKSHKIRLCSTGGEFPSKQLGPVESNLQGLICVEYQFNAQMHFGKVRAINGLIIRAVENIVIREGRRKKELKWNAVVNFEREKSSAAASRTRSLGGTRGSFYIDVAQSSGNILCALSPDSSRVVFSGDSSSKSTLRWFACISPESRATAPSVFN